MPVEMPPDGEPAVGLSGVYLSDPQRLGFRIAETRPLGIFFFPDPDLLRLCGLASHLLIGRDGNCCVSFHPRTGTLVPSFPCSLSLEAFLAKVTLIFAVLLVVLGLLGFIGTASEHPTALIPLYIGVALGLFGYLASSPSESRRKLFMHVNVTIGLLGFLGATAEILRSTLHAKALGIAPDTIALTAKSALAALLLLYIVLCVRSFIAARRSGKV